MLLCVSSLFIRDDTVEVALVIVAECIIASVKVSVLDGDFVKCDCLPGLVKVLAISAVPSYQFSFRHFINIR